MTPCTEHHYFLPRHGLFFEAFWPRPAGGWIRALRALVTDGPIPGSPEYAVDPGALSAAVELVEKQDIEAATMAFTELGYEVQVHVRR